AAIDVDNYAAAIGDPEAPVTIVEYTDYQCPFCQRHSLQTLPDLLTNMIETGRVYYVLKDFPLDNIHPDARAGATAARCAGEQDAYWEMHDMIFGNQSGWAGQGIGVNAIFVSYAETLGLDAVAFSSCQESGRYDAHIQSNVDEGASLGVGGTPFFFIDGFPINGAQPYELFDLAVGLAEEGTLADAYARPEPQPEPTAPSGPVNVPLDDITFAIGDPNAPVTIVEYTDFQCPFCARHFLETYPQIKANFVDTGQVYYVFKDFPLTSIHPQAVAAAQAARCAGDQDAYLEMHDGLFSLQDQWANNPSANDVFIQIANQIGLETEAFTACLTNSKYESSVMADLDEGVSFGVRGTPAFFINGNYVSGAQPYNVFVQAINQVSGATE
ncbi:MAG: DsbA family protein, partial [Anaerolineae bacterium]